MSPFFVPFKNEFNAFLWLLPSTNEVWGKVIFLHMFVILFTGGGAIPACIASGIPACLAGGSATGGVPDPGEVCCRGGGAAW